MLAKLKYLLVLPFICLFAWLLTLLAANFFAQHAVRFETEWKQVNIVRDMKSWIKARDCLKVAIRLDPYNPDYPEMMGRLYIWRYSVQNAPVTSIKEANRIFEKGLEYIQLSISKRPTWFEAHSTKKELEEALEDTKAYIQRQKRKKSKAAKADLSSNSTAANTTPTN